MKRVARHVTSLRAALLFPLLWLWLVPALVATLTAFWLSGQAADAAFDRVLKDDALALAGQVHWDDGVPVFRADPATAASLVFDSLSPSHFTVYAEPGRVLAGNAALFVPAAVRAGTAGPAPRARFFDESTPWGALRIVALRLEHPGHPTAVWVVVGEARSKREHISHELAAAIFLPAAAVGFVLVPFLFLGVRHGLAPARDISEAVARRSIDDLSPLPLNTVPEELRGLIVRINDLLARLAEAIAHERRFIAEAAHQLRTPAAGIKLLAEDLARTQRANPRGAPDAQVLEELLAATARNAHLVRQLLALARAERLPAELENAVFDLAELARAALERWQPVAAAAHKRLDMTPTLRDSAPLTVRANPALLEEALGNLIDNAIAHGGDNIGLDLRANNGTLALDVRDDGACLPASDLAQMFLPFWRGPQARPGGSGLGLAIAQKTARLWGGDLSVRSGPQPSGTCFTLTLPRCQTQLQVKAM